jgi:signal transduction histidine kinase
VNPGDLLDQTEVLFRPVAEDMGLMFEVQAPPELPPMQADYARIRQVLDNLIINALRHVPAQGSIWLAVRQQEGRLRFDVANSGVTLDQRKAEHVFDRFWRADESRQRDTGGSGLGLSIAHQIVQLHQGRIWVELGENRTTFSFEIPAA